MAASGPLEGIRMIDLTSMLSGPWATMIVADQGADVIKVEEPRRGDHTRSYGNRRNDFSASFLNLNRNKRSIVLDLKTPEGLEACLKLAERCDAVLYNIRPQAMARLGLSYRELSALKPEIIVCDISGYGSDGPYRDKKAYDLLIQSESGFLSVTGTEAEPSKAGPSIADISAGMYAYGNILAALLQRQKTGRGQHLDISMLESLVEWMNYPLYYAFDGAAPPRRTGASHATIYPYGPFPAGDGKVVMLGLQNEREWGAFCEKVLLQPQLASEERFSSNSRRSAARDELRRIILDAFATLTADEVIARLDDAQIANAHVNDMHAVWAHPQLQARHRWREVGTPAGAVPALLPPGSWEEGDPRMDPVPALGEHSGAILAGLGYPVDRIAALRSAGVI